MITASLGSRRFESGPTYHFNDSNTEALSQVILDPTATTDYINVLPGVNASREEVRQVAASGVVRLAIETDQFKNIDHASKLLLDVCRGSEEIQRSDFIDKNDFGGGFLFGRRGLPNKYWDSASVLATRKNNAEETAGIIRERMPTDEGYFVIGIANGGIISTARTFLELGEGSHGLAFVGYSRYKDNHVQPEMRPYPEDRARWLKRMAGDRQVVIHDEDYVTKGTITTAVKFFGKLLDQKVYGIVPVNVDRRITYNPLVVASE